MALESVLPQGSGVGAFLKLSNKIELLKDNSEHDMVTRTVKGVARFVATYALLAFFAKLGLIYNAGSLVINAGLAAANFTDEEKVTFHIKECARNLSYGVIDLVGIFKSVTGIAAVANAVIPDATMRTYERLESAISSKPQVSAATN